MPELSAWPDRLCNPHKLSPNCVAPFRWAGWIIGTDGEALGAVPDDEREANDPHGDPSTALSPLNRQPPEVVVVPLDALREWAGPHEEPCPDCTPETRSRMCTTCHGQGSRRCNLGEDHGCGECGGKGGHECSTCYAEGVIPRSLLDRLARVQGVPFNRRVLADVLHGAPDGGDMAASHLAVSRGPGMRDPILIVADGWRAMVMPIQDDAEALQRQDVPDMEALAAQPTPEAP